MKSIGQLPRGISIRLLFQGFLLRRTFVGLLVGWIFQILSIVHVPPSGTWDFHEPDYIDAVEEADLFGDLNPVLKERYKIGLNGNPIFHGMYMSSHSL